MPNVFEAVDPRGRTIVCTEDQWLNHVLPRHRTLAGREQEVKQAIESPAFICSDADFPDREAYYYLRISGVRYLKVVVRFAENTIIGTLITAFPTDSGKAGERILWMGFQR